MLDNISKPFTFVSNTYAKANEVNADFDELYKGTNACINQINESGNDISTLQSGKADKNGNASNRFSVANPVNNSDAVNKQYLMSSTSNARTFIEGYTLTRSGGATITISKGSCYDEGNTVMLSSNGKNLSLSSLEARSIYYVYVYGNSSGNNVDFAYAKKGSSPVIPSGYVKRMIGRFNTGSSSTVLTGTLFNGNDCDLEIGSWIKSSQEVFNDTAIGTYSGGIDLSSYLPDSTSTYDVLFNIKYGCGSNDTSVLNIKNVAGGSTTMTIAQGKHGDSSNNSYSVNTIILPITSSDRTTDVEITNAKFSTMSIYAIAFRKVN